MNPRNVLKETKVVDHAFQQATSIPRARKFADAPHEDELQCLRVIQFRGNRNSSGTLSKS
jgi:hypothetical protein